MHYFGREEHTSIQTSSDSEKGKCQPQTRTAGGKHSSFVYSYSRKRHASSQISHHLMRFLTQLTVQKTQIFNLLILLSKSSIAQFNNNFKYPPQFHRLLPPLQQCKQILQRLHSIYLVNQNNCLRRIPLRFSLRFCYQKNSIKNPGDLRDTGKHDWILLVVSFVLFLLVSLYLCSLQCLL